MALSRAGLIVDTTSTSGTGTYTLNDPAAPGGGFRTLADAVADGDVANGDTVYYWVVDTTKQGAALEWEHGIGTVGSSGTTLARTTILESSNGDAAVNWGSGGSRTVRFGVGVSGLALLAATNSFNALQTFLASFYVDGGSGIGLAKFGASAKSSGICSWLSMVGDDSVGNETRYADIQTSITDAADGSEDGRILFGVVSGGVEGATVAIIDNTGVKNGSGTLYGLSNQLSAPSGTRLLIGNASVPTGWTIVASLADKVILTTSTASEIDDTGGTWAISGLSLTATVPAYGGIGTLVTAGGAASVSPNNHTHDIVAAPVDADGAWRPAYYKAGWIAKS